MDEFRRELPIFSAQLDFIDLTGLSLQDVKRRVASLPENSAIVYTAINIDGAGVSYIPRDALVAIAEVANRPIVIDAETMLGYGGREALSPAQRHLPNKPRSWHYVS